MREQARVMHMGLTHGWNTHRAVPDAERRTKVYRIVDLGEFKGNHNLIHGINNRGAMVGAMINPETTSVEACVIEEGISRMLGTLGGSFSVARAINNEGEIVGGSLAADDGNFHAFLFVNEQLIDLNRLIVNASGWELVQAIAINDTGQIVGIGSLGGKDRIFLLMPIDSTEERFTSQTK